MPKPHLERQAIGRIPAKAVVVAQLWSGLPIGRDSKPRWAVVLVNNGYIAPGGRTGTENEAKQFYEHTARHLDEFPITEARAREVLTGMGVPDARCPGCNALLPIGGRFCDTCGRPGGNRSPLTIGQPAPGSNARPIVLAPLHVR